MNTICTTRNIANFEVTIASSSEINVIIRKCAQASEVWKSDLIVIAIIPFE